MGKPEQLELPYVAQSPRGQRVVNAISKAEDACAEEIRRFGEARAEEDRKTAEQRACDELERDLNSSESVHVALLTGKL